MSRVAAIDCGTNSIRLLVADVTKRDDGSFWLRDVYRTMKINRLGQGVDATGRLAPEALQRTEEALREYAKIMVKTGVEAGRMVATSASRDAENKDEFFSMTESILGAPAEVISGDEEARLSFIGGVGDMSPEDGPFLVTDIGGGSTELVLGTWDGTTGIVESAKSVNIGCVRLTERALPSDPPSAAEIAAAEALALETLEQAFSVVDVSKAATWIGVAGTVTTLGAVALGLSEYDAERTHLARIGLDQLSSVCRELTAATHAERRQYAMIHEGRIDVIGGGSIVVRTLAEQLAARAGIREMVVSEKDILDGIALSIASRRTLTD
jgi:exopolyphosphatase/guanosine-5'-triphosphate,3'-diphosphate pyrophosphatase